MPCLSFSSKNTKSVWRAWNVRSGAWRRVHALVRCVVDVSCPFCQIFCDTFCGRLNIWWLWSVTAHSRHNILCCWSMLERYFSWCNKLLANVAVSPFPWKEFLRFRIFKCTSQTKSIKRQMEHEVLCFSHKTSFTSEVWRRCWPFDSERIITMLVSNKLTASLHDAWICT